MSALKSRLESLAASFATEVVRAIQSSSLEDLLGEVGGARRGPGRPPKAAVPAGVAVARPKATKGGRLRRRSPEDIEKTLTDIVSLLKSKKDGLRSEQIRASLKMRPNEMPRVLKEGLAKKVLKSRGQKRATTYYAA